VIQVGNAFHTLAPWLSWWIVIGGLYGALRLVVDVRRAWRWLSRPRVVALPPPPPPPR
jgi:hypothetical protein